MAIDEISNLIPPANPHPLTVPRLSPRPRRDGEWLPRDREITDVRPPPASTSSGWPRVFPGL
jgi:hypothetical protein